MNNFIENTIFNWIGNNRFISMQIDITNFCNLACTHCYHPHHTNKGALSLHEWIGIIDQYEALIKRLSQKGHIIICGGEPLTSPFLVPLLENIKTRSIPFHITILTNGTLLKKIDLNKFTGFEKMDFQVSLDGPNKEIHDSFRGSGNFQKALDGIIELKRAKFPVYLQATLTKLNSQHIDDFFTLAKKLEVDAMNFTRLIAVGSGEKLIKSEEHSISPLELKAAFEKIIISSARTGVKTDTEIPLMNLIHPALGKKYSFGEGIVIDYQGYLLASSRSRVRIGSLRENKLEELFFGNSFRRKFFDRARSECSGCPHFNFCGGDLNVSYGTYGDFFKKDPGCWKNIESA